MVVRCRKMPKRVLLIGILFCLGGVLAIWDVVSDLSRGHIDINLAVFLLPVGIGLLKGKRTSQWWARLWVILGYVACFLLATASPENVTASWFGREMKGDAAVPYVVSVAVAFALALLVIHRLLYSEKAMAFFSRGSEQGDAPDALGAGNRGC